MSKYHIYTDGSARFNPGVGGWGTIVMNEEETEIVFLEQETAEYTTNNRMELKALICALNYAESHPQDQFIIYSDSAYVVNSYNSWIRGWAAKGWKNSKKQTVENLDLMQALYKFLLIEFFNAEVRKCDGHAGNIGNELADAAATSSWRKFKELVNYYEIQTPTEIPESLWTYEFKQEQKQVAKDWFPVD